MSVDKSFELLRERRNEVLKRESPLMEWRRGVEVHEMPDSSRVLLSKPSHFDPGDGDQ